MLIFCALLLSPAFLAGSGADQFHGHGIGARTPRRAEWQINGSTPIDSHHERAVNGQPSSTRLVPCFLEHGRLLLLEGSLVQQSPTRHNCILFLKEDASPQGLLGAGLVPAAGLGVGLGPNAGTLSVSTSTVHTLESDGDHRIGIRMLRHLPQPSHNSEHGIGTRLLRQSDNEALKNQDFSEQPRIRTRWQPHTGSSDTMKQVDAHSDEAQRTSMENNQANPEWKHRVLERMKVLSGIALLCMVCGIIGHMYSHEHQRGPPAWGPHMQN